MIKLRNFDVATQQEFYARLCLIRMFEEQVTRLAAAGEPVGLVHLSVGQEAVAVGVCAALGAEDYLFTGHRAHGHVLAKGSDPVRTLAEILGRRTGLCSGRGGSMHLVDRDRGILGATGVVGGNIPLAVGTAWAARQRGEKRVTVVFFGDGATGSGLFHESLNLASLWEVPLLFVCENNGYAEFTSRVEHSRVPQASDFATTYGIPSTVVDGSDVLAVTEAASDAAERLRSGEGPFFLECMTYRRSGHFVGDPQKYRSAEDRAMWLSKDPILRLRGRLLEAGVSENSLAAIESRLRERLEEIVRQARAAAPPDPGGVMNHVYTQPLASGGMKGE
jgi:acetoin:2,6-dichlorophenolindophenol oxidoreductase subunit alpha